MKNSLEEFKFLFVYSETTGTSNCNKCGDHVSRWETITRFTSMMSSSVHLRSENVFDAVQCGRTKDPHFHWQKCFIPLTPHCLLVLRCGPGHVADRLPIAPAFKPQCTLHQKHSVAQSNNKFRKYLPSPLTPPCVFKLYTCENTTGNLIITSWNALPVIFF